MTQERPSLPIPSDPVSLGDGVVLLDPFTDADVADLLAAHGDPALSQWVAGWWQEPATPESAWAQIRQWRAWTDAATWAIREAPPGAPPNPPTDRPPRDAARTADRRLLGSVNVFNLTPDGVHVGYWLAPWARGRGVMARAARLAGEFGLSLGAPVVMLYHAVENPASCAVATRAGYVLAEEIPLSWEYPDGRLHDEHLHLLKPAGR